MDEIEIKLKHGESRFRLVIKDKITVVVGDSATGKSSLARFVSDKYVNETVIRMYSKEGIKYKLMSDLTRDNIVDTISESKNTIFIIDEDIWERCKGNNEVYRAIRESKYCYFLFTTRSEINLNYSIDSTKVFKETSKVAELKPFITVQEYSKDKNVKITDIITEDTGKGYDWFNKLMATSDVNVLDSYFEYTDNTGFHEASGKDSYCARVSAFISENMGARVLMIFDKISFGSNAAKYKRLIEDFGHYLYVLSPYKSFEHLILNTNMYKDYNSKYDIDCGMFEEAYYEKVLEELSSGKYTSLKHDSGGSSIGFCYTGLCTDCRGAKECTFKKKLNCKNDKFVALLKGTEFRGLLGIAERSE